MLKNETYQSKIAEGQSDPRSIRKLFKELIANGKGSKDGPNINLKLGVRLVTNESDLTEILMSYFVNVASNLKEPSIPSDFEIIDNYVQSKVPTNTEFQISLTNETIVRQFLTLLNVKESTVLDNIGPKILKLSANILTPSLTFIVNKK